MPNGPIVLISGANRGLGKETARQLAAKGFRVIIGARDEKSGSAVVEEFRAKGLDASAIALDVSKPESIIQAARTITSRFAVLDVLINNAGIYIDGDFDILGVPEEVMEETLRTNFWGALLLTRAMAPLLRQSRAARVINISSGLGSLSEDQGTTAPSYSISKTAVNALTKQLAAAFSENGIPVNSVCPGWVRTDMGGASAHRSVEQGVETIVWLASEAPRDISGKFLRDKQAIDW